MSKKEHMRLTPYNRNDDIVSVGVEFKGNMSTMDFEIGTKIELVVVGIERRGWEGMEVR
jgi:hypothetical protein